ncbi:MAG: mdtE [Gammaproteobacteria bacterium]|nr:mdtE [Gammaproteobacteria bacterium]
MLIVVSLLFGGIFSYKIISGMIIGHYMASMGEPPAYVSATTVKYYHWQPQFKAAGSLRAVLGINVTTELAGMVRTIHFTPGAIVKKDDLLVQLDIDPDMAQLHALQANAELAAVTFKRDSAQFKIHAISKATLDIDIANLKNTEAQVARQAAIIAQKTIRAPFSGRLGISAVNPGQYINPGDKITMLQTLDPMYVDFYVPQEALATIKTGQLVAITVDTFPNLKFNGVITTINPGLDSNVRNAEVEATIANPKFMLSPGMFAAVTVNAGKTETHLTLPLNAVSFNPYGELVYVIKKIQQNKKDAPLLIAKETFVVTGEKRGNQVAILQGLKEGDQVVTSGQLKLKNGSAVIINNSIIPKNNSPSKLVDE